MNKPGRTLKVDFQGIDTTCATFSLTAPTRTVIGGTHDPQFIIVDQKTQYTYSTEHLHFLGGDGGDWLTKAHAEWTYSPPAHYILSFSNGHPGQPDHDGEMPLIKDWDGSVWKVDRPEYSPEGVYVHLTLITPAPVI